MLNCNLSRDFARRTLALAAVFATGIAVMGAQTPSQAAAQATDDTPTVSATAQARPAASVQATPLFSSSADEATPAPALEASLLPANPFGGDPMQYGGGQRSRAGGRPRYRGNNSNPDGSNKYMAYGGFGLQQPVGNTYTYFTPSWGLQAGFGRQFSKNFALPIEFDYDHLGMTGKTLANQLYVYNQEIAYYNTSLGYTPSNPNYVSPLASLDGNAHVWSFSVDPTYTFIQGEKVGAYAVAGAGFYHKVSNFTTPVSGCDPYYLYYYGVCYIESQNATVEHFTSNAPGFSGGLGLTYKFSRFSSERFYAEVRYVFVDNSKRTGLTAANLSSATINDANDFPANSNHTTYFPIKFGIRF